MKKFLFATLMGALVALAGCQQDEELTGVENTLGKKVSVTANIQANAQSRVAMEYVNEGDYGPIIKVKWKESGESFFMYENSSEKELFKQIPGSNQFEGKLPPSYTGEYMVEYGNQEALYNQDGTLNEKYVVMYGVVTDLNQPIEFKHATTVLKPNFLVNGESFNKEIKKIEIEDWITVTPNKIDDIFIFLLGMGSIPTGNTLNFTVTSNDQTYKGELTITKTMELGYFYTATIELEEVIPYVTFTAGAYQKLKYTGNDLQYSTDGINFNFLSAEDQIEFNEGVKLYLRGNDNFDGTKYNSTYGTISFTEETRVACTGDIRTLIDYDTYETVNTSGAYFSNLFQGCVQLTSAPALPATTLAENCYQSMFDGCTSLEVAPELPAETLVQGCYELMFSNCTSLNNITMLATDISATNCLNDWVKGVPATGTFTKAASMTSLPTGISGIPTGWTVVDKP